MASRQPDVTVQSVLGKISQDHLECPICTNRFTEPKVLDCLHSFCQECLKEVRRQSQHPHDPTLECPLCRHKTVVKGDVSNLPSDFKLSALADEVDFYEKLLEGQRPEIKCQACDERNQAVSRCMDCDHFLCRDCQAAHGRMTLMKSHQIYTLAQLQSGEVPYKSKIREYTPKCGKHSEQNLNIYCDTCEKLVCTTCAILQHEKHSRVDLLEAVDKCKRDVARMSLKAEQIKAQLKANISKADDKYRKLNAMYADTTKKISSKADKEVARITKEIREEEQKLTQEADEIFKDRTKTLETVRATNISRLTETEKKLNEVRQFVTEASCYEILDFESKLLYNLKELTEEQPEEGPDSLPSIKDFEEGIGRSLGRLVLEETLIPSSPGSIATAEGSQRPARWERKIQMKTFGKKKKTFGLVDEVAAFSNNEIVVLDRQRKKLITFLTNDNIPFDVISQELQLAGLDRPTHVSVNRDDEIVILDSPRVKFFHKGYQPCLHQFLPGGETGYTPTCLAVDGGDMIAVGYEKQEMISLHKRDGSLIRRIHAPNIGFNLAIHNNQRLIYNVNAISSSILLSVDCQGNMVFSVKIPSNIERNWYSSGLCCDKDSDIYITVCTNGKPGQGEIQQFSRDGQYIGYAINECGNTSDVAFTPAGELVLASVSHVALYHRV